MGWKKPALISGVVFVLLIVLVASLLGGGGGGSGVRIQVEKAQRRTVTSRVKASGEITAETRVAISTKVIGEIVALPVKEGDEVKSGDVLVQIERKQFDTQRDQARSAAAQAEVAIKRLELSGEVAKRNLDRAKELKAKGFGSDAELENAEVAYESAQVELESQRHTVEQAKSQLQRANDDLERTTIRSPIDGRVISLDVTKGETAIPGTMNLAGSQLMTIADMSHLVAEVEVAEADVVRLKPGQVSTITVDALGSDKPLDGVVRDIASSGRKDLASGVVKFRVKIALTHADPALHPSMSAKVNVVSEKKENVVSVPIQAVVKRRLADDGRELDAEKEKAAWSAAEDREVVYLAVAGKAKVTRVSSGASDDVHVEIVSGVQEGADVIIGPYRALKDLADGAAINAEPEKATPSPSATASTRAKSGS